MEKKTVPKQENKLCIGHKGEEAAISYLTKNGYTVLERNFRYGRMGEIDIIAREDEYICFIEVKTRNNLAFGMPAESVTAKKREKIRRLAWLFLKRHNLTDENVRFDVVEVFLGNKRQLDNKKINLIRNAF